MIAGPATTGQMTTLDDIARLVENVQPDGKGGFNACCPCHESVSKKSLHVSPGDNGGIVLKCWGGCQTADIVQTIGLTMSDLRGSGQPNHYTGAANGHAKTNGSPAKAARNESRKFPSCREAADAIGRNIRGQRVGEWPYQDERGRDVMAVFRWDLDDGGKTIRPVVEHPDGGWSAGVAPDPRPMFRLPDVLKSAGPVWWVEGERKAECLRQIGLTASTSSGGANALGKTDISALAGRRVNLWRDHDAPGQKYAEDFKTAAAKLNPVPTIHEIDPNTLGLKESEDAADWIESHDAQAPEDLVAELQRIADESPVVLAPAAENASLIVSIGVMVQKYPHLRPVVIDGLLRQGEVCNVIAKSKVGKSWLGYGLGLSVVVGGWWLGRFPCTPGKVLLIDNELHPEVIASRVPAVASAMGLRPAEYADRFDVLSLRGRLTPIDGLGALLRGIERNHYGLIILDALYRLMPTGSGENDNAGMTAVYNLIDQYAESTGAGFVLIHHASKGDQSGKDVTDVGSGAGSQSRAADTHLVIRPHEEDGAAVLDAAVRSFAPIDPLAIRWEFPRWVADAGLDPERLKRPTTKQDQRQQSRDADGFEAIIGAIRDHGPSTPRQLRQTTGISKDRLDRLLGIMRSDGRLTATETTSGGNMTEEFSLADYL